jgi:hypothetical protein
MPTSCWSCAAGGLQALLLRLRRLVITSLSFPVAFQYPASVALFVRIPVGYFLSRKLKKYHSFSPIFAFSATTNTAPPNLDISTAPDQYSTAARITKREQLLDLQYYS